MRNAKVFFKDEEAGILTQKDDGSFVFEYHDSWIKNPDKKSISLTLPKVKGEFQSPHLFPFFYNLLPEGSNRMVACKLNRIDEDDHFGLLLSTARYDSIGAVRIVKLPET